MKYLLDTHIILWILTDDNKLKGELKFITKNLKNKCFISNISLFEIAIKINIGKLDLEYSIEELENKFLKDEYEFISLKSIHLNEYQKLPIMQQHKDPFDRLLISTAIAENMTLLSADSSFQFYENMVKIIY